MRFCRSMSSRYALMLLLMKKLSWSLIQSLKTKARTPAVSSRKKMIPRKTENWNHNSIFVKLFLKRSTICQKKSLKAFPCIMPPPSASSVCIKQTWNLTNRNDIDTGYCWCFFGLLFFPATHMIFPSKKPLCCNHDNAMMRMVNELRAFPDGVLQAAKLTRLNLLLKPLTILYYVFQLFGLQYDHSYAPFKILMNWFLLINGFM